jgi:SAM-dependent methyltransferase
MACLICGDSNKESLGKKNAHELFRCHGCGFIFVDPIPSPAELDEFYQNYKVNPNYARKTDAKVARTKKRIARYIQRAPGKRFLDVGCNIGTGVEAARLLGLEAFGIDIDAESIGLARELYPQSKYHAGPIESLPSDWGSFDFIYSSEVIEHLPEPHAYYDALVKRMSPNALLYITTPDAGHWRLPRDFISWNDVKPPEHLLYFTRPTLKRFLESHGLTLLKFEWNLKPGLKALLKKD